MSEYGFKMSLGSNLWHSFGASRCASSEFNTIIFTARFISDVVVRPSVCRLSVSFVRPTQAIEIFDNVSTPFGTLAICRHPGKILRRSSQGNPPSGELNTRGVGECTDFGPIELRAKLVLITNKKSHIWAFDWYQTRWPWMTLNGVMTVTLRYFNEFG